MRLSELEPRFVRYEVRIESYNVIDGDPDTWRERGCPTKEVVGPRQYHIYVNNINDADGIWFLCPECFKNNHGSRGTHSIVCWRPRVSLDVTPGPGRWEFHGTGIEDIALVAGSSSILLTDGCKAHFFIRNGDVIPT